MTRAAVLALVAAAFIAADASALKLNDGKVVIPIIGRFPGVGGSQWRTDVFIGSRYGDVNHVKLTFYVQGGAPLIRNVTLPPYSTLDFPDITLNTFGLTTAAGPLEIETDFNVEARARIFNSGNASGEFGQGAPALPVSQLTRQAFLYGLSGLGGNRVNVGVTNPNATATTFVLYIADRNNNPLYREDGIALGAHQNIQFNDIFSRFFITPQDGVQVIFLSPEPGIYGYASQVRNDTGDAVFIVGTSPNN